LVALDFAVVARSEGSGLVVPGPFPNDSGEVVPTVAGAVVGHDTVDLGDAVGGEPGVRPGQERGCGAALLVE
jgi:hypothetical protein